MDSVGLTHMAAQAFPLRKVTQAGLLAAAFACLTAAGPMAPAAYAEQAEQAEPAESAEHTPSLFGSYLSGRLARSDRDTAAAADFYSKALQQDPDSDILLESAYTLEAIDGNWDRATDLAAELVKHEDSHRIARYVLGAKAFKDGDYEQAKKHFSLAKKGPISDLTVGLVDAWIELAQGHKDEALASLDAMKQSDWSLLYQRFHRGLLADLAGKPDAAEESFAAAFKKNERTLRIAEAYARSLASRGDVKRAKAVLRTHLSEGSTHPIAQDLLDQLEKGNKVDRLVTTPGEGMAEVLYGIGDVLTSEGGIELGTVYLQLALYIHPDFPLAQAALGEVYESNQKYELAIAAYDKVDANSPLHLNVQIRKAFSLNALDKVDEAKGLLEELANDFPNETKPLDALGSIMRARERYDEAQAAYGRALALVKAPKKEHWALYYARGVSYERLKQWPKAESDLKMALKLNPEQGIVLNYLGYTWVDQGKNLKQAMSLIRKAVKLKPDDGYFVDSLGWAYYRLGNYTAATEHLERATELRPEDPVINDHLGDAYWKVGRRAEAKFQWSQALTLEPEPEDAEKIKKKLADGMSQEPNQINAEGPSRKSEN